MLILTRKPGETIYVGNDITITVIDYEGKRIKLGINAPSNVSVDRKEIRERKEAGLLPPRKA